MMALCVHSATMEETRRIVREAVEMGVSPTPEKRERGKQIWAIMETLDKDAMLSAYCEILAEKFDDPNPEYANLIMRSFYYHDGYDVSSYGHQEALDWARKVYKDKNTRFDRDMAMRYLRLKGDARDLAIIHPARGEALMMRVAGTNLLLNPDPYPPGRSTSPNVFFFAPSVTNTGPQGLYAEAIVRQFWEKIEPDSEGYREKWKIPAELLTLVVWFDAEGNPVCNVDLSKYGLTMPVLEPKPTPPTPREPPPPTTPEPTPPPPPKPVPLPPPDEAPPPTEPAAPNPIPWKLPLFIGILILGGVVVAWRYFKRR